MKSRTAKKIFLVAALVSVHLSGTYAVAQQHPNQAIGLGSNVSAVGAIDHVNAFNGNLTITIPIGQKYMVNGNMSYGLTLVYNGKPWDHQQREYNDPEGRKSVTQAIPNTRSNAGNGWLLTFGKLIPPGDPTNNSGPENLWLYESADGAHHRFYPKMHPGGTVTPDVTYTGDGTFLRMTNDYGARRLEFPTNVRHSFDADGKFVQMTDQFGNEMHRNYTDTEENFNDSTGRVTTLSYSEVRHVARVTLPAVNSSSATYFLVFEDEIISRSSTNRDSLLPATALVTLLKELVLPDGTKYSFDYYKGDKVTTSRQVCNPDVSGDDCSNAFSGHLKSVTLPTLGRIEYNYRGYFFPGTYPGKEYRSSSTGLSKRRLVTLGSSTEAEWQYQTEKVYTCATCFSYRELKNSRINPDGSKLESYFSVANVSDPPWLERDYSLPFTRRISDSGGRSLSARLFAPGNSEPLRSTYVSYEMDTVDDFYAAEYFDLNRRVKSTASIFNDDADKYLEVTFSDYDGLGHYRTTTTGGNFGVGNVRSSFVNWNPAAGTYPGNFTLPDPASTWLISKFTETSFTEGLATAKKEFCFDDMTGALNSQRTLAGSTRGASDLVKRWTRNADGNITTEESFGGDTQSVGTGSVLCALSFPLQPRYLLKHEYLRGIPITSRYYNPTSPTLPLPFYVMERSLDARTGLTTESKDSAGLITQFTYDTSNRVTRVTKPSGAFTEYKYINATASTPARVETTEHLTAQACTAPLITTQPQSSSVTSGTPVTLQVAASGSTPLTYTWEVSNNGVFQPAGSGTSLTVSPQSTSTYRARVVNGCGDVPSTTATITVITLPAPYGVTATASVSNQISIKWSADPSVSSYRIERSTDNMNYSVIGSHTDSAATIPTFTDTTVSSPNAYLYRIRSVNGANVSAPSLPDLSTMFLFFEPQLFIGSTLIRATHFTDLRTVVNSVRALAGMAPAAWTNSVIVGGIVRAVDLQELRTNLNQARGALGLPTISYEDPTVTVGVTSIRAAHIEQLRDGVR